MVGRPQTLSTAAHAVLCVDDEPQLLEALALTLGHRYYVELAASGQAALEKLRSLPTPTVIVSDMRMPKMNGAQLFSEALRIAPDARRILLTGHADVQSAIAAVNEGRIFRYLTKPCATAELVEAVEAAIADYEGEMRDKSAIRRTVEREIECYDRLTGLTSRERLLDRLLALQSGEQADPSASFSLFLIELKESEDLMAGCGALAFDRVMCILKERLESHATGAHLLARAGSHSLAAILPTPLQPPADLELLGIRLHDALALPADLDGLVLPLDVTIGVVRIADGSAHADELLRRAEHAARTARRNGNNRVCVHSPESAAEAEYRCELSRSLRLAVANATMTLHFQPIMDVVRNSLHSVEALARWEHPQLGFISPATFIPLLEQMGLMVQFGEWALTTACRQMHGIVGPACPRISVNVSITQILHANFLHSVYSALEDSGLAPGQLEIEVTESLFVEDIEAVCTILEDVRALGVHVALDDFGAGYSSLHTLNRLPVDVMKIDGVFARDFDTGGEAIIDAALSIARKLELDAIVEGIESERMLTRIRELGATKVQGFLLARPMTLTDLKSWLLEFGSATRFGLPPAGIGT
jgi:predicted signal transduction protein with EAL and GGDEF domain